MRASTFNGRPPHRVGDGTIGLRPDAPRQRRETLPWPWRLALAVVAAAAGCAGVAQAWPAAPPRPPVRLDVYGDPLPPGAVARMGSIRLRHPKGCRSLTFAPGGKELISFGRDNSVRFWDPTTGKERHKVRAGHWTYLVELSQDAKVLIGLTKVASHRITIHDPDCGRELRSFPLPDGKLEQIALRPDAKMVALGFRDGTVTLLDLVHGKELHTLSGDEHAVSTLDFSPDGTILAVGDYPIALRLKQDERVTTHSVRLWDVAKGKLLRQLPGHEKGIWRVGFSPDGKLLAVTGTFPQVRVWDVKAAKERCRVGEKVGADPGFAWSPSGDGLAITARGGIQLCDLKGHRIRGTIKGAFGSFAWSPDGRTVATVGRRGGIQVGFRLWDVPSGKEIPIPGYRQDIICPWALCPNGKILATGTLDGSIRMWDVDTGKELRLLKRPSREIHAMAFSPDGAKLAVHTEVAGPKGDVVWGVVVLDTASGKVLCTICNQRPGLGQMAFSPDGRILALGDLERPIRFWDVQGDKEVGLIEGKMIGAGCLTFSPDGRSLAVVPFRRDTAWSKLPRSIQLWDLQIRKLRRELISTAFSVDLLGLSPSGDFLVARVDDAIVTWDLPAGKLRQAVKLLHFGQLGRLCLSPDGSLLAAGGRPGDSVRVLEVASGQEVLELRGHLDAIHGVQFHPDGRRLVSVSKDGTALVWDLLAPPGLERAPTAGLAEGQLSALWGDLADAQAYVAYRAHCRLVRCPREAAAFLGRKLQPDPHRDAPHVRRLVAALDSDDFAKREAASAELGALGALAEPELRDAAGKSPSAEVRQRAAALLRLPRPPAGPEALRRSRAVRVLVHIGSPAAREVLMRLAAGEPLAEQTRDARAVLRRLERVTSGP